ncbi:MAG: hypothetical protein K2V38_26550 [Gemmataceae bacterium]|nr:hypothetical protein [Gemmataceae bacterium]
MTDRDLDILTLAARYGLMTPAVLHPLFFAGLTEKAVERVVTRLVGDDLLRSQPLVGPRCCYTLTAKAARLLGLDEKRYTLPAGPISLIKNYGILVHSLGGPTRRQRMTAAEFGARFPGLDARGMSHDRYFLDDFSRLSLFVCDHGADWRRLTRKVRKEADRRGRLDAWKPFFAAKLFSVTLLSASAAKTARLTKALDREPFPVVVATVPELARLIGQHNPRGDDDGCE